MNAIHRVATNTGILYLRMAITVFISLYATRLVLTALGIENFGLYNLVGGVIAMLGFLNGAMAAATQRFMSIAQGAGDIAKVKRIFNMSTVLHAGIAILVVVVLEIAGYYFFNGILNIAENRITVAKLVYQFMVISTLFTIISVPYEAVITSHENMLFYAILGVGEALLKLAIALYISYGTLNLPVSLSINAQHLKLNYSTVDSLTIYGLLMAVLSIVMLIIRRHYCHKKYAECEFDLKKHYDKNLLKEITSFAGWSFLTSASSMIAFYGQGMVVNVFFGTAVNAAQGITAQISGQLGVFATTLMKALNPVIDKSEGAGDRKLMLKATMMGSKVSFFLIMLMYIPFLIETPFILKLWLINVPEYTLIFCQLLLIRNLIDQIFIPLNTAILAVGKIKNYQISTSLLWFSPLVITYMLFTLGYQPYALYVVFIINAILMAMVTLYYAKKHCQLSLTDYFSNVIVRCASAFVLVFLISLIPHFFGEPGFIRLLNVTFISLISYLIIVFFIGFSGDERMKVKKLVFALSSKLGVSNFVMRLSLKFRP